MKSWKRRTALFLALAMMLACAGAAAQAKYPDVVEGIDFGGATVTITDYWTYGSGRLEDPDEATAARYAYEDWIQKTYNVNVKQERGGDWGTCAQVMTDYTIMPEEAVQRMFIIEPGKVARLISNGIAGAINDKLINLEDKKWNQGEKEFLTIGEKTYGLVEGASEPRAVLFFNKRVLEEVGIDWNTIYDMQKAGTWTWEAFEELLKKTTRDTDNDGVNDVYGIVGSGDDLYVTATFANGGSFFEFTESGDLVPVVNSEPTMEALNWGVKIRQNYWMPTPEDANWDWYKEAWKQGNSAFYMYQAYGGFNDNSEMADMADDWGCVAFPVNTAGDPYVTVVSDNVLMIPSNFDEETNAKLAFLYDLWTEQTPGYESDDAWIGNKYNYTDERAVDETYAMLREGEHNRVNKVNYLGTQNDILGVSLLWCLGEADAAELVEAGLPEWNELCKAYNGSTEDSYGWITMGGKKYYLKQDGTFYKNTTVTIDGIECVFDAKGRLANAQSREEAEKDNKISAFVERCYQLILGRNAEESGLKDWAQQLKAGTKTAAEIISGFTRSDEFKNRGVSGSDTVEILYNTMLDRGSDPAGKESWETVLENGCSSDSVINGFCGSAEFANLCSEYGITAGSAAVVEARDANADLTAFVNRCYTQALNRDGEPGGLNDWCTALLNKEHTPKEVASGFVFSQEMADRNLSNEEKVDMLYRLYLGREADPEGRANWVEAMNNGMTLEQLNDGFADSVEFGEIVNSYGLGN